MKRAAARATAHTTARLGRSVARTLVARVRGRSLHREWGLLLESAVRALRDNDTLHGADIAASRAGMEKLTLPSLVAHKLWRHPGSVGGVSGLWLRPKATPPRGTLVWLHGGAYVMGSSKTHADLAGRAALAAGCDAFVPDYRLAPEHPAPAAIEDAVAVVRGLYERGLDPKLLVLVGDSAGGGLTLATLVALRDAGLPQPAAAALLSPWVDLEDRSGSALDNARYDWIAPEGDLASLYAGGRDLRDPQLSPIHADLRGLAPLFVEVGTAELLLDQVRRLADALRAADADVFFREWPHMVHVGYVFAPFLLEARTRLDDVGAFLAEHLDATAAPGAPR